MHPDIPKLLRLQEADLELHRLDAEIRALVPRIEQLDRESVRRADALKKAETLAGDPARRRVVLEKELPVAEQKLARYRKQQELVKTSKEFEAIEHEVAGAQALVTSLEEKIFAEMEAEEIAARDLASKRENAARQTTAASEERARLAVALEEKRSTAQDTRQDRIVAANLIAGDEELRDSYEWALKSYGPPVVVTLKGESCGGCGAALVPHLVQRVKRGEELVPCDHCRRYLYQP